MAYGKNVFVFITSAVMAVVFILYALLAAGYQNGHFDDMISFTEDGSVVIMGKSYKPDKAVTERIEKYLALCENAFSRLFPKFITSPIKSFTASVTEAVCEIFNSSAVFLSEIAYGNM